MPRKFKVSRKIYELEKKLFSRTFWAKVNEGMGNAECAAEIKAQAYDIIFSLSLEDQAALFEYRAHKDKAHRAAYKRQEMCCDEIANAFGYETWEDFALGRKVNIAKMVSLLTNGEGQQSNRGRRLKAQLEKLFHDSTEQDLIEIID
jgi:hypothetical protein